MSNIIRKYTDHMNFAAFIAFSFIIFLRVLLVLFYHCIYDCVFYMLSFNFVNYVFLLCLCIFIVSIFCSVHIDFWIWGSVMVKALCY